MLRRTPGKRGQAGLTYDSIGILRKGDLNGFWSISVRANWRVIFRFEDSQARDVDLVDYH